MTNEYENWEHGDYTVIITPDNVEALAQSIQESNPNYPTYVFYDFAKTVYYQEMRFSEFMDKLDSALENEIERNLMLLAAEGKVDIHCNDEGGIDCHQLKKIQRNLIKKSGISKEIGGTHQCLIVCLIELEL